MKGIFRRATRLTWVALSIVALTGMVLSAVQMGGGDKPDVDSSTAGRIVDSFMEAKGLRWTGTKSVNKSSRPGRWRVWSGGQVAEVTFQGEVVWYMDSAKLLEISLEPSVNRTPALAREELERLCRNSRLLPKGAQLDLYGTWFMQGVNRVTFMQKALGRPVRFNFVVFRVTSSGEIASFSINWTDFDPKAFSVRFSQQDATSACDEFFKQKRWKGRIDGAELAYLYPNDAFGVTGEKGIHLAYAIRYVLDPAEYGVAELWIDASSGGILGGNLPW